MVYTLNSLTHGAVMTKEFPTEDAAMFAAVEWVQVLAETYLSGTLTMRWSKARAWWVGQGGMIEIKCSLPCRTLPSANDTTPWSSANSRTDLR